MSPPTDESVLRELAEGEELTVFRVVHIADSDDPAFVDGFRSHAELGLPPRPRSPEVTHPLVHRGISVFDTVEAAAETAEAVRRGGRDIGGFVAEVRLTRAMAPRYSYWGARGHLTLWCDPVSLSLSVVGTMPIDEEGP